MRALLALSAPVGLVAEVDVEAAAVAVLWNEERVALSVAVVVDNLLRDAALLADRLRQRRRFTPVFAKVL